LQPRSGAKRFREEPAFGETKLEAASDMSAKLPFDKKIEAVSEQLNQALEPIWAHRFVTY
jgi:hypothetical protein